MHKIIKTEANLKAIRYLFDDSQEVDSEHLQGDSFRSTRVVEICEVDVEYFLQTFPEFSSWQPHLVGYWLMEVETSDSWGINWSTLNHIEKVTKHKVLVEVTKWIPICHEKSADCSNQ